MPSLDYELPTPALLAPILAGLVIWALVRLRGRATPLRVVVGLAAAVYAAAAVNKVLLPVTILTGEARERLSPWTIYLQLVPFASAADDPSGALLNVLLFVPLGVLLPLVTRIRGFWRITAVGALVSLGIETVQFAMRMTVFSGRIADIDDLIANTVGAALGAAVYLLATRLAPLRRLIRAAELPAAAPAARRPVTQRAG
ncbi:VanZ family protein [Microbacterium phosphatis]|uniref:VanZ family protein n=1 Tax=Microbacterium phosphatis TaxID=3140248 RepID=UPI00313FF0E8